MDEVEGWDTDGLQIVKCLLVYVLMLWIIDTLMIMD
jgi:hypothetical protein